MMPPLKKQLVLYYSSRHIDCQKTATHSQRSTWEALELLHILVRALKLSGALWRTKNPGSKHRAKCCPSSRLQQELGTSKPRANCTQTGVGLACSNRFWLLQVFPCQLSLRTSQSEGAFRGWKVSNITLRRGGIHLFHLEQQLTPSLTVQW